jgi:hypothetical protein
MGERKTTPSCLRRRQTLVRYDPGGSDRFANDSDWNRGGCAVPGGTLYVVPISSIPSAVEQASITNVDSVSG